MVGILVYAAGMPWATPRIGVRAALLVGALLPPTLFRQLVGVWCSSGDLSGDPTGLRAVATMALAMALLVGVSAYSVGAMLSAYGVTVRMPAMPTMPTIWREH